MKEKSVLIIGPLFYDYSKSVGKAFEKEGFNICIYDKWVEGQVENVFEKIEYNVRKDKAAFFNKKYKKFNENIKAEYTRFEPSIVFIIRGAILNRDTLLHMKKSKLLLWMMDSVFFTPNTITNIDLYDKVFLFEKEDVPLLKEKHNIEAYFLPLALDEDVYFYTPIKNKPIDILFVGNLYPKRIELLRKIIAKYPSLNIKIYGVYFSKLRNIRRYLFRKDKQYFLNKTVSPAVLNSLYNQTKICINIHHNQSVYGVNQRFFEILGAKAFQICDKHGFVVDNFSEKEVLTYDNDEALFAQINYALQNYDNLSGAINDAHQKVVTSHTFTNRIKFILQKITE